MSRDQHQLHFWPAEEQLPKSPTVTQNRLWMHPSLTITSETPKQFTDLLLLFFMKAMNLASSRAELWMQRQSEEKIEVAGWTQEVGGYKYQTNNLLKISFGDPQF